MSGVTEEQRRRAEENRRKALEMRAQRMQAQAAAVLSSAQPSKSASRFPNQQPQQQLPTPRPYQQVQQQLPMTRPNQKPQQQLRPTQQTTFQPNLPYSGPIVTGTFRLISRSRFVVDMNYHAQTIALFKTVPGCCYNPSTRKWDFPLSEYQKVLAVIESLKPQVTASPLPSFILRIFRNSESTNRIPDLDLSRIDPVLVDALLPFQREGVCFGISRGGRVLIADDMGLGKTIQALGIAHYYYSEWPLLIVTPASVRYAWRDNIWKWLPSVPAGSISVIETKDDFIMDAKILIMSYDLLHRRSEEPPIKRCKVIIVDESHHLKNWKTARAKATIPLVQNCNRALLLSGTPALSRPIELYTQISAVNRSVFPQVNDFGVRYCAGKRYQYGWDHNGSSNMEELQLLLEETIMIRRLKSEVLTQLPSKLRQMVILDPHLVRIKSKHLQQKAKSFVDEKQKSARHGKLLEYFSETGRAKLDAVANYITELVESGKKFLCFAHHRAVLDGICDALERSQCRYIRIDGSTSAEERNLLCDRFQCSEDCLVAVLSITAANSGITLTAASLVLFAELYWNPGILTQAEDRAHRIGQEDSVVVQYLVAQGTADDEIWKMVADKLEVLNKAGLSKDNFREANSEAVAQQPTNVWKGIENKPSTSSSHYGNPTQGSSSTTTTSTQKQTAINDYFQPTSFSQIEKEEEDDDDQPESSHKSNNNGHGGGGDKVIDGLDAETLAEIFDASASFDDDDDDVPTPDDPLGAKAPPNNNKQANKSKNNGNELADDDPFGGDDPFGDDDPFADEDPFAEDFECSSDMDFADNSIFERAIQDLPASPEDTPQNAPTARNNPITNNGVSINIAQSGNAATAPKKSKYL